MRLAEDLALEATLSGVELQPSDGGAPIRELSGHCSVGRARLRIAGGRNASSPAAIVSAGTP